MELGKVSVDCSIAAEDESGGQVLGILKAILSVDFYAAASKAINYLRRYAWMKQRNCDHE